MSRLLPEGRDAYRHFRAIGTRWMDNDVYGHVNNVVYYSFFDTAVNGYLIEAGALDIGRSDVIGLVVETRCNYFAPLTFPQAVDAGLRVAKLGRSSVRYEVGLARRGPKRRRRALRACLCRPHDAPPGAAAGGAARGAEAVDDIQCRVGQPS